MPSTAYLEEEEIVLIHNRVVEQTGGLQGIRNPGAVASVAHQPRQAVFGKDLYPTVFLKAAVYAFNIITQHPFVDGNKRTGVSCASVFLECNGYEVQAKEGELFTLALAIAEQKVPYEEIAAWFESRVEAIG